MAQQYSIFKLGLLIFFVLVACCLRTRHRKESKTKNHTINFFPLGRLRWAKQRTKMKKLFIIINKKEYQLNFGFGALRIFCNQYGEDTISSIDKYLTKLANAMQDPTFESLEILANMVIAGVKYQSNVKVTLTQDQVIEAIINQVELTATIIEAFASSLPKQPKKVGKQKTVQKQ